MIFCVDSNKECLFKNLSFTYKINHNIFLHTLLPINDKDFLFGYKLDHINGNFVKICFGKKKLHIQFSLFKDYEVWKSEKNNIYFSNYPTNFVEKTNIPDILDISFSNDNWVTKKFNWIKNFLSIRKSRSLEPEQVIHKIRSRLIRNLKILDTFTNDVSKIVFTGGLDSGVNALLAHNIGINFECLVNSEHSLLWNLPFNSVTIRDSNIRKDRISEENIKESFYQPECNNSITGFFGDTTLLHNSTLYFQSKHFSSHDYEDQLHDRNHNKNFVFKNISQMELSIVRLLKDTKFQQWFEDFIILDTYRDIELAKLVLQLSDENLIRQFGTGFIQKEIISELKSDNNKIICKYKNDYSKFV